MNLSVTTTSYGPAENQEWLGSAHGTQAPDSIMLDGALCAAKFASGLIPSGIPLKRQASGKYAPAVSAEVADYHLFTTIDLTNGGRLPANTDSPAAGLWHAQIIVAKVPSYADSTSVVTANTTSGLFRYV